MSRGISRLGREKGAEINQTRVSKCTVAMVTAIKQASLASMLPLKTEINWSSSWLNVDKLK